MAGRGPKLAVPEYGRKSGIGALAPFGWPDANARLPPSSDDAEDPCG